MEISFEKIETAYYTICVPNERHHFDKTGADDMLRSLLWGFSLALTDLPLRDHPFGAPSRLYEPRFTCNEGFHLQRYLQNSA